MNINDIVIKTAKGVAEVEARSKKLPQRLRTILILLDGTLTVGKVQEIAGKMSVPADFLETLLAEGLIETRPAGTSSAASATATPVAAPVVGSTPTPPVADVAVRAVSDTDRFRAAQKIMNATVVDALGMRAFMFTLKLERCFTVDDLRGLVDDYVKAITKGSGEEVAAVLKKRLLELLG